MKKTILIILTLLVYVIPAMAQVNMIFPNECDLVIKTGQEFLDGKTSVFIDDIEIIKKDKFCSVVKISSSDKGIFEITIAEKDQKNGPVIYYTYEISRLSSFKYNNKEYVPLMALMNHLFFVYK